MKYYTITIASSVLTSFLALGTSLLILLCFFTAYQAKSAQADKINCGAFPTRQIAQDAYDKNPAFYSRLDGNKNKLVCESYEYIK